VQWFLDIGRDAKHTANTNRNTPKWRRLADSITSRIEMTLDSTLESVSRVEQEAEHFAERAGFDPDEVPHIAMAVRECAINAVMHGNAYSETKKFHVSFAMEEDVMKIVVSDSGQGVDLESLPNPLAPENILRGSGRGIFLVKAFMDDVHFRKLDPGTEVTLTKRRTSEHAAH